MYARTKIHEEVRKEHNHRDKTLLPSLVQTQMKEIMAVDRNEERSKSVIDNFFNRYQRENNLTPGKLAELVDGSNFNLSALDAVGGLFRDEKYQRGAFYSSATVCNYMRDVEAGVREKVAITESSDLVFSISARDALTEAIKVSPELLNRCPTMDEIKAGKEVGIITVEGFLDGAMAIGLGNK